MLLIFDEKTQPPVRHAPRWLGGCLVLGLCGISISAGAAYDETHVYGIANFGDKGQCGTKGMTHSVHTDTAASFLREFSRRDRLGLWGDTATMNNASARASYFTDPDRQSWGYDDATYLGTDDGDVLYVHTHGRHDSSSSFLEMGSSENSCEVSTSRKHAVWRIPLAIWRSLSSRPASREIMMFGRAAATTRWSPRIVSS